MRESSRDRKRWWLLPLGVFLSVAWPVAAQSLNWEGQTGAFVTPFAYTAGPRSVSVSFHHLSAGPVIGRFYQTSVTSGLRRLEFGYTRTFHRAAQTPSLSGLWRGGFNTAHGKLSVLSENARKSKWVPAVSVGFVARAQVRHVTGVIRDRNMRNGDLYVVATKTITQVPELPLVLNVGLKTTNASVFGLAGNAPAWQGRLFGAGALVLKGPARTTWIAGAEFAQQPREVAGVTGAVIPTTATYFVRLVPLPESKFNIDVGIAQVAGRIAPGVNVASRKQFAMGISYRL